MGTDPLTVRGAIVHVPARIVTAGQIVFCTDIGYPPMEFEQDGVLTGAEIEIGREVARRLGVAAAFVNQRFDGIVDALYAGRCDAILCAMTDKADRRDRLTFVDYIRAGQVIVVPKGNPKNIRSVEDLADQLVLVQDDTSKSDAIREFDAANQRRGLLPMRLAAFKGTTQETTRKAAEMLRAGRADADFLDLINAAYNVRKYPDAIELAGGVVNREPYGIAFRKDDTELQEAVCAVVKAMYLDGTMLRLLRAWDLEEVAFGEGREVRISG